MKTHSEKFLQQRRFYMILPLLVLPFLTMIFWALGGGKGGELRAQEIKPGLNMELPGARFTKGEELWDKFSLYEQAKRDSIKMEEAKRNDPYYVMTTLKGSGPLDSLPNDQNNLNTSLGTKDRYAEIDVDQQALTKKLEQLTRQLTSEESSVVKPSVATPLPSQHQPNSLSNTSSEDVDRLEKMMTLMNAGDSSDPEMEQMDTMLEKILDIQHPERVTGKLREKPSSNPLHEVKARPLQEDITVLEENLLPREATDSSTFPHEPGSEEHIGFYGLIDESPAGGTEKSNAFPAVIHDTQTVVAGSTIKLRLLADVTIDGQVIEKDQFIYGVCSISGERLIIQISSVRSDNSLFNVALNVYDLDGLPGIYIPGAISRDVGKQATSQGIQDVQMYSMENSLEVQAASAGIEAAKGLFSKKIKLVKVTLKAGYQVLLKDKNVNKI
jgi:conjugative transposon TraM protein